VLEARRSQTHTHTLELEYQPSLQPSLAARHHHHLHRASPPLRRAVQLVSGYCSHPTRSFLPASDHSAPPPRLFALLRTLSPLGAPSDSVTRPLALPPPLSSSPIPTPPYAATPVAARAAVVVVLLHTLALYARPRPTAPAPQPSTSPRCLLPSSQKNGIWRRQRPGFAFSQVSTGAQHAIGHQAACPRTLSPVLLLQRPPHSMCRESTFLASPKCPTPEPARSFVRRCEALHTVAFHTCLFVYFIISHGRRQADTEGVRSRRQCCLRLFIMAPFGDQRLRRNTCMEEWLRHRVAVRYLFQVSYHTSYSHSNQC
jgi:hypothetical protein